MGKFSQVLLLAFVWLGISCLTPVKADAALRPLTDLGYFRWTNQTSTPAENTFLMRYGEQTTVEPIEGNVKSNIITVDRQTSVSSALIKKVGFYKGKEVNLKVTLKRNKSNLDGGSIYFTKDYFLSIEISGEMVVTYDFLDSQGKPMTVETAFNYYGMNHNKYIGFQKPGTVIKYLYANNPTNILYDIWDGGGDDYWGYYKNVTVGIPWYDPRQNFEIATNPISKIMFMVHNNDSTPSSIDYRTEFLAKPEFSPAYAEDSTFETADQGVYVKAYQTIPDVSQWKKATAVQVSFHLAQIEQTRQYMPEKIKVTNFNGDDLTDLFTSESREENLVISAKDPSDGRLYDTVLQYHVYLKWIGDQHPVDEAQISAGQLTLPFRVQTMLDGRSIDETSGQTLVNYMGKAKVIFEDEEKNSLLSPVEKNGVLTTAFDFTKEYPDIPGYIPMKNEKNADQGQFLPKEQTIMHLYRRILPLTFVLKNKENPWIISRFSKKAKLDFSFSHEERELVHLFAKCHGQEQEIKSYDNEETQAEGHLDFRVPDEWIGREVSFYLKSNLGRQSQEEKRRILIDHSPKLLLPERLNFGVQEIPANEKEIEATNQKEIQIEAIDQSAPSKWTIKVREEKPLTNTRNFQLSPLEFVIQGKTTILTDADQSIWEGSGNAQLDSPDKIQLKLHPSDESGSYEGTLVWTLEDAPV